MSGPAAEEPGHAGASACPRRRARERPQDTKSASVNDAQSAALHKIRDVRYEKWCAEYFRDAPSPEQYDDARRRVMELRTKAKMMREAKRLGCIAQREIERQATTRADPSSESGEGPGGDSGRTWHTKQGHRGEKEWRARRNANGESSSLTMAQRMRATGSENFTTVDGRITVAPELRPEGLPGLLLVPNRQSMADFAQLFRLLHALFYTLHGRSTHKFAIDFARMLLPEVISSRACAGMHASRVEVVFAVAYALGLHEAVPKDAAQERVDGVQALSLTCSSAFWNRQLLRDQACAFRSVLTVLQFLFGPVGTSSCIEGFKRRAAPAQGLRLFESNEARAVLGIGSEEANMLSMNALWQRWLRHLEHVLRAQQLDGVEVRSMLRAVKSWGPPRP